MVIQLNYFRLKMPFELVTFVTYLLVRYCNINIIPFTIAFLLFDDYATFSLFGFFFHVQSSFSKI